eukprot:1942713-Pyramimonas_sp.AAC.1
MRPGGSRPWGVPRSMIAVVGSMADPRLERHPLPDPGFRIEGFLIQCPRRSVAILAQGNEPPRRPR